MTIKYFGDKKTQWMTEITFLFVCLFLTGNGHKNQNNYCQYLEAHGDNVVHIHVCPNISSVATKQQGVLLKGFLLHKQNKRACLASKKLNVAAAVMVQVPGKTDGKIILAKFKVHFREKCRMCPRNNLIPKVKISYSSLDFLLLWKRQC